MAKNEDPSIRLSLGRLRINDGRKGSGRVGKVLWYFYYFLASLSVMFWFVSLFRLSISVPGLIMLVLIMDSWYALVFFSKRTIKLFLPITAVGLAVFILWKKRVIWRGLAFIVNTYAGYIQEYYQYNPGYLETGGASVSAAPVTVAVAASVLLWIGYGILKRNKVWNLLLLEICLLCAGLAVNRFPHPIPVIIGFLATYGITCMKNRTAFRITGSAHARAGITALLTVGGIALLSYLILSPPLTEKMLKLHPEVQNMQDQLEAKLGKVMNNFGFQENGLFGSWQGMIESGILSNEAPSQEDVTAIRLNTHRKPDRALYFRGFIGGVYQGTYWQEISEENFAAAAESWEIYENGQTEEKVKQLLQTYPYQWQNVSGSNEPIAFDAELEETPGDYAYLPYFSEIMDGGELQLFADGEVLKNGNTGFHGMLYEDSPELMLSPYLASTVYMGSNEEIQAMTVYEDYVMDHYMYVPRDGLDRLKEHVNIRIQEAVGKNGYYPMLSEVTDMIREDLNSCRYSLDLEPVPSGVDYTENFFFDQKEGFCTHFASTAVLMYRLAGYPARYVTGYIGKPSAFSQNEDGTWSAEITDRNAHAWAEVFVSQVGWVPVEMTPGFSAAADTDIEDLSEAGGADLPLNITTQTPEPTQEIKPDKTAVQLPAAANSHQKTIPELLLKVFVVLAAVAFLCLLLWLRRLWILAKREQRFRQKNCSQAILSIVRETEQMLISAGYRLPENLTDAEYAAKVQQDCEVLKPNEFPDFMELGQQACFSGERMTVQDVKQCVQVYEGLRQHFYENHGVFWKLWWRFIKCY